MSDFEHTPTPSLWTRTYFTDGLLLCFNDDCKNFGVPLICISMAYLVQLPNFTFTLPIPKCCPRLARPPPPQPRPPQSRRRRPSAAHAAAHAAARLLRRRRRRGGRRGQQQQSEQEPEIQQELSRRHGRVGQVGQQAALHEGHCAQQVRRWPSLYLNDVSQGGGVQKQTRVLRGCLSVTAARINNFEHFAEVK